MRYTLLALLFTAAAASAQTLEQVAEIRFDEQPMSARTAAMGGAGDALGSDGSELALNPALTASLKRPVFAVSGVESTFDVVRFDFDFERQQVVLLREPRSQRAFAHLSAVVPWRGAVLGVYARNEPRAGNLLPALGQGRDATAEYEPLCSGDDCQYSVVIGESPWERRERRYGLTAAMERGAFSFGAGAELQELDETYETMRAWGPPLSSQFERVMRSTSGRRIVPNAGVRWRVGPRFALAAAYNGAASYEQTEDACRLGSFPNFQCASRVARLGTNTVGGADAYRASVAMLPLDGLTVVAEVVRRNHEKADSDYRNVTDIHAGAEYRIPRLPVSLRAGWQRLPPKYEGFSYFSGPQEAVEHATYGMGVEVRGARIDFSYDDGRSPAFRRAIVGVSFTPN
jgi:hypothetical protein